MDGIDGFYIFNNNEMFGISYRNLATKVIGTYKNLFRIAVWMGIAVKLQWNTVAYQTIFEIK